MGVSLDQYRRTPQNYHVCARIFGVFGSITKWHARICKSMDADYPEGKKVQCREGLCICHFLATEFSKKTQK